MLSFLLNKKDTKYAKRKKKFSCKIRSMSGRQGYWIFQFFILNFLADRSMTRHSRQKIRLKIGYFKIWFVKTSDAVLFLLFSNIKGRVACMVCGQWAEMSQKVQNQFTCNQIKLLCKGKSEKKYKAKNKNKIIPVQSFSYIYWKILVAISNQSNWFYNS